MILDIRCHAILDPEHCRDRSLPDMARAAVAGGATILQYRDKRGTTREMVERTRAIVAALSGSGVPLLVNDRADVAFAGGAAGVHVGQEDLDPRDARRLLGPAAIVGQTVKTDAHAAAVPVDVVDYVCIGGVYTTVSKHNPEPPVGLDGLSRLAGLIRARRADLPVGAIAGITAANAAAVVAAGADGVAAISEIFMADDVAAATAALVGAVAAGLAMRTGAAR